MNRYAIKSLQDWFKRDKRKPLVIRGARQVGKSTLVNNFAKVQSLDLYTVNLEKHRNLDKVFETLNTRHILQELEVILGKKIEHGLLFLDEIQATPNALAALRYFYEEYPQLPVIAAGSLLEFTLREHTFSMPVGRIEFLHLGPMTFQEYLQAVGDDFLLEKMRAINLGEPFSPTLHEKLLERQKEYFFVGGLPEAVWEFASSKSFVDVARVHESIAETYINDFAKYRRNDSDLIRLQNVFNYIPRHVGERIVYSRISDEPSRETKKTLELLTLAQIVSQVPHSDCSGIPLHATAKSKYFKCLFLDIGLMNKMCGLDISSIRSLSADDLVNKGSLAEQFVGQHLLYRLKGTQKPVLCFWVRDSKTQNAEVDFVVSEGDWVIPIEVKAGKSGTLKSLHQFVFAKKPLLAVRFYVGAPLLQNMSHELRANNSVEKIDIPLLSLPLYMVEELPRIVAAMKERGLSITST